MNKPAIEKSHQHWHLSKSIPVSLIAALIVQTLTIVWWASDIEHKVESNYKTILRHISNEVDHMPFDQKITVFIPRVELEKDLNSIKKSQDEIKDDLKALLRAANN